MPSRETDTGIYELPMPTKGVNLYNNILKLDPEEAVLCQNAVYANGVSLRGGGNLWASAEVVASNKLVGLHRFYQSDGTKQQIAVAGTIAKYWDGAAWQNIKTGLTNGTQCYISTWGYKDKCYFTNGVDTPFLWDGSTASNITGGAATWLYTLPYADRLLVAVNETAGAGGGHLIWPSSAYSDTAWYALSDTGVSLDTKLYGMSYHSEEGTSTGSDAKVLVAGATGMFLFSGTDLRTPATTGDYEVQRLAINVGCSAPRTMCWTPKGSIWLGNDRQVYILEFDSVTPIPISRTIWSKRESQTGLDTITSISNACAAYHKGYYILSVTPGADTVNSQQWWLDVEALSQTSEKFYGPWFGPMTGQSISCFCEQGGEGDAGSLIGGEANAKGYVYELNRSDIYSDIDYTTGVSKDIAWSYQSPYHVLGENPWYRKDVHMMEISLLNVPVTVNVQCHDITGAVNSTVSLGLPDSYTYWDDAYWDEEYFSSSLATRLKIDFSPALHVRLLSVSISSSNSANKMEIYTVYVKATEMTQVFE